jgi:hypothetical protein
MCPMHTSVMATARKPSSDGIRDDARRVVTMRSLLPLVMLCD